MPSTLVGRDADLSLLESQLDLAVAGGRRIVLVAGEAGLGKTALVEQFAAAIEDRRPRVDVLRGLCVPMGESGLPFTPVLGLLRAVQERHGTERLVEWAGGGRKALGSLLPDVLQPAEPADGLQLQLFEAVTRVLEGAAAEAPVVAVVEDVHWADESSRGLIQFVARRLGEVPVLLVCTYRPDEVTGTRQLRPFLADLARLPWAVRVELARLGRSDVVELLTRLSGSRPAADLADDILRRSEGVPFYVEELAGLDGSNVPESLRGALEARTLRLDAPTRATLGLMAVGGIRMHHELLVESADAEVEEVEAHMRAAVDVGLVSVEGPDYAFRHALFGEALYADLLPGQRARLHAAMAHAIERRPDLVADGTREHAVALHWSRTGDHERTFAAAVRATRAQTGAHAETLAMYERVLELWDLVPEPERTAGSRLSVLTGAARAARDTGEFGRAIDLFTAAIDETGPDDVPGRIEWLFQRAQLMSDALRVGGDRDVKEAEELLATVDDPAFRARMLTRLATYRLNVGLDALPRGQEAVEASRLVGDRAGEADARTTLGTAMVAAGLDEPGLEELRLAREAPLTGVRPRLRNLLNTSDALHLMGRYEEAIDMALQGLSEARALRGRAGVRHLPGGQCGGVDAGHRRVVDRSGPARRRGDPRPTVEPPHPPRPAARVAARVARRAGAGRRGAGRAPVAAERRRATNRCRSSWRSSSGSTGSSRSWPVVRSRRGAASRRSSGTGSCTTTSGAGRWSPSARLRRRSWMRGIPGVARTSYEC